MPRIHVHVHTADAGTSEGAKKAAITRKQHAASTPSGVYAPKHRQLVESGHKLVHSSGGEHWYHNPKTDHVVSLSGASSHSYGPESVFHKTFKSGNDPRFGRHKLNYGDTADGSVEQTMHEYKHGELRSGSKEGPTVKSRKQAVAIALSQAGKSKDAGTKDFLPG